MTSKFNPIEIANKLNRECLPRENMTSMGVNSWNKALKVLKILAEGESKLWPFVDVYNASKRYVCKICSESSLPMSIEVKILIYEEWATKMVNDPNRW